MIRLRKYKALIEICLEYLLIHLDFLCPGNLPPWVFGSTVGLANNKVFTVAHPLGGDPRPPSPYLPVKACAMPRPAVRLGHQY